MNTLPVLDGLWTLFRLLGLLYFGVALHSVLDRTFIEITPERATRLGAIEVCSRLAERLARTLGIQDAAKSRTIEHNAASTKAEQIKSKLLEIAEARSETETLQ